MRHYEIVFLVHPDQSKQVPAMIDRYSEMVTASEGQIHRSEDWGRRRLAYMINDVHKAHYVLMNIECDLSVLAEIQKNFKFNDSVLRHLVVRRQAAITEASAIARQKAKDDAPEAPATEKPAPAATKAPETKAPETTESAKESEVTETSETAKEPETAVAETPEPVEAKQGESDEAGETGNSSEEDATQEKGEAG